MKTYVVGTHKKYPTETLLMGTHNIYRIWPIWYAIPIKNSNLTDISDHFTTDFMKK